MVQDYNYTIPRRPIAAMFASPGPALYTMPTLVGRSLHDPRSVHVRYPAYSIASRVYMHTQHHSPGPKYFPLAKVLCSLLYIIGSAYLQCIGLQYTVQCMRQKNIMRRADNGQRVIGQLGRQM